MASSGGRWAVMHEWRSVFSGTRESADSLARELESAGLRAFADSKPGSYVTKSGSREWSTAVLVPPQEFDRAVEVTRQWRSRQSRNVSTLSARLARIFGLSLVPPALWYITSAIFQVHKPMLAHLVITWLVSLVALAQVEHRRRRNETIRWPTE